jgi:twitching motility protein PilT
LFNIVTKENVGVGNGGINMELSELIERVKEKGASDLHLIVSSPPVLRIDGALEPQEDLSTLTPKDIEKIYERITTLEQRNTFSQTFELDFAYSFFGYARFRVNVMRQRGSISLALRLVPVHIASIDELGLPQILKKLILKPRGLILVTGPTGSGKSTTLAAMIDHLNKTMRRNVITIEDPIEFLHRNIKCIIHQRDLGDDTKSFDVALIHALRHDPDVIVVGEMRDLPTVSTAIRAAETGHLVLGTLHTTDAARTVNRLVDMFPAIQQEQIKQQVAEILEAVLSQTLVSRVSGGRTASFEILLATPAVRNLIREGKTYELPTVMQLNVEDGMQTMDDALSELVEKRIITLQEAMSKSSHPDRLKKQFELPQKQLYKVLA